MAFSCLSRPAKKKNINHDEAKCPQFTPKDDIRELFYCKPPEDPAEYEHTSSSFWYYPDIVHNLRQCNFQRFLKKQDAALVMFYYPFGPNCMFGRYQVDQAAKSTVRENHAYAGVNCLIEHDLCAQEGVDEMPFYKLYSRGNVVGTFHNYTIFTAAEMKKFMEMAPVLEKPRGPKTC